MKKILYRVEDTKDDISFNESFKSYWSGIFSYGGKENRRSFLYHLITYLITSFGAGMVLGILMTMLKSLKPFEHTAILVISIPILIALWAAFFRRMRDIGFTTLGIFVALLIYIILVVLCPDELIFLLFVALMIFAACIKSNKFTINPKSFWTCLFRGKELKEKPATQIDHEIVAPDNHDHNETL